MKFICGFLAGLCLFHQPGFSQRKLALIIANARYDENKTGWPALNSDKDIDLIRLFMRAQSFDSIIVGQDLTKLRMQASFDSFKNILHPGDNVMIHVSAHGQQVADDNKDEPDGYDEALVPLDCPASPKFGNHPELFFRDDELENKLNAIRTAIGKNGFLVFTVDACHSGSLSRGTGIARGGKAPYIPSGVKALPPNSAPEKSEVFLAGSASGSGSDMAPMVMITAARPEERDYEYYIDDQHSYGSLSYAIYQSLPLLTQKDTYRTWFGKIQALMAGYSGVSNHPQLEGVGDRRVFDGAVVEQDPYFSITDVIVDQDKKEKTAIITGGYINGLAEGTTLIFCKAGILTPDSTSILFSGHIRANSAFSSAVSIPFGAGLVDDGKSKNKYWVFVNERKLSFKPLTVYTANKELKSLIQKDSLCINADENNADFEVTELNGRFTGIDHVNADTVFTEMNAQETLKRIKYFVQGRFLRSLSEDNPATRVEMQILPAKTEGKIYSNLLPLDSFTKKGELIFKEGDWAVVSLKNISKTPVYFNIIDIQPDGIINPIIPHPDDMITPPENFVLAPGKEILLTRYPIQLFPPFGKEVFKLFTSLTPIDLKFLINNRGDMKKGRNSSLEKLFGASFNMTRGTKMSLNSQEEGSIATKTFLIIPNR